MTYVTALVMPNLQKDCQRFANGLMGAMAEKVDSTIIEQRPLFLISVFMC